MTERYKRQFYFAIIANNCFRIIISTAASKSNTKINLLNYSNQMHENEKKCFHRMNMTHQLRLVKTVSRRQRHEIAILCLAGNMFYSS